MKSRRKKITTDEKFGKVKDEYFDLKQIDEYFRKKDNANSFQTISDKTCNDLDFSELYMFLDRTTSKIGQQFLYNKLRNIPNNLNESIAHEKLVEEFANNSDFRLSVQYQLLKLNNNNTFFISALFQDEHLKPPKWFYIVRILSLTSILSLIMVFFKPIFLFLFFAVLIINLFIHYWNKNNLNLYICSLPQLLILRKVASELFKNDSLREINPNLQKSIRVVDKVRNRMIFFQFESNLQGEIGGLFWFLLELVKIVFLIEPLFLFGILKRLDTKRKEIEDIFMFVGKIDSLISIASLRKGLTKYCKPSVIIEQKEIVADELYHPLIHDCVNNSIHVNVKSVLLTGSNMSGKTSFIRAVGINVITGLTINTCFAEQFYMPKMKVFSAIRISDDLMNDRSYYFEEVLTIKEMIFNSKSQNFNLFLLDEIFKGTNTIERISAGKAVLSYLSTASNIVFVSTHDVELADLLKNEYELYHFSEKVDNNTVDFDYKLKIGKLKNRNAIRILQINNYPDSIISEALEISNKLDEKNMTNINS